MKQRHHTPEQVIRKLAEGDKLLNQGQGLAEVCRHLDIAESTWHRWKAQYGGMKANDAKRLKGTRARERSPQEDRGRPDPGRRHAQRCRQGELLTPNARRRAVVMLEESFGVKERRACRVMDQHRSNQSLEVALPGDGEQKLRRLLVAFAKEHPRWGWKRAYHPRRREGRRVNKKRVQRLWRLEGLKVPHRNSKKPPRGIGVHMGAMSPIRSNAIWAMDFQFDETRDGKQLKLLNIATSSLGRVWLFASNVRSPPTT